MAKTNGERFKVTIPKPVVVEVSEEEDSDSSDISSMDPREDRERMAEEEEEGEGVRAVGCQSVARRVGRPPARKEVRRHSTANTKIIKDYRRYSERSKKKPDFFGVEGLKNGKKGKLARAKRTLYFGSKLHQAVKKEEAASASVSPFCYCDEGWHCHGNCHGNLVTFNECT